MRQVRIHGRGGQGVVTAAEMLARAGFIGGKQAQAIPSFGSERTGAPVVSTCRFSDQPIRTREPVLTPDVVLVQDPTLLATDRPLAGLPPGGLAVVNTSHNEAWVRAEADAHDPAIRIVTVPALALALEHLGRAKPAAGMLGAYAAAADDITLAAVQQVFREHFLGPVGEANAVVAQAAFDHVRATDPNPPAQLEPSPSSATARDASTPDATTPDSTPKEPARAR